MSDLTPIPAANDAIHAWAYVVRSKEGREFLCLGTISRSKTKTKTRLNSLNANLAARGRPFFEPVALISVQVQPIPVDALPAPSPASSDPEWPDVSPEGLRKMAEIAAPNNARVFCAAADVIEALQSRGPRT